MITAIDIETTGLSPWKDEIRTVQIATKDEAVVLDMAREEDRDMVRPFLARAYQGEVIVHNAAFDLVWLHVHFGQGYPARVWDTMVAEQLLTAGYQMPVSLEAVAHRRLGKTLDKSFQTSFDEDGELTEEQLEYAAADAAVLLPIASQQRAEIRAERLEDICEIEMRAVPIFCDMIRQGIYLDREIIDPLLAEHQKEMERLQYTLQKELTSHVMGLRIAKYDSQLAKRKAREDNKEWLENVYGIQWDERQEAPSWKWEGWDPAWDNQEPGSNGRPKGRNKYIRNNMKEWTSKNPSIAEPELDESPINLNSQPQLKAALDDLGIEVPNLKNKTLKGMLPDAHPEVREKILRPLLAYKKHAKMLQSFGGRLLQHLDEDSVLHGGFRQIGTQTGRPTCKSPNLLQMPKSPEFRAAFRARPGNVFVVADYSQMELRIGAQLSGDKRMSQAFLDGKDLHRVSSAGMFGVPEDEVTDDQRKSGKILNFGIFYSMWQKTYRENLMADGIERTPDEAIQDIRAWKETYPEAVRWIDETGKQALLNGFTRTPFGRKRRFRLGKKMQDWEKRQIARRGANFPIQGGNADVTKLAMILIDSRVREYGGRIVLQVYDEIVVEAPEEKAQEVYALVTASMAASGREVLTDVPCVVDGVISRSWSEEDRIEVQAVSEKATDDHGARPRGGVAVFRS